MGTSKSKQTPTGGAWSPYKRRVSVDLHAGRVPSGSYMVGGALSAAGGLPAAVSRGGGSSVSSRTLASAAAGLASFGAVVLRDGLTAALDSLGLAELEGRPAVEVIERIAGYLSRDARSEDNEVLRDALGGAILEIAQLEDELGYEDLEAGLERFLQENGIVGVLEEFLVRLTFEAVWSLVEQHVRDESISENAVEATVAAIDHVCRAVVHARIEELRSSGQVDAIDWFGPGVRPVVADLVSSVESRLIPLE